MDDRRNLMGQGKPSKGKFDDGKQARTKVAAKRTSAINRV
jgi:hypothetical protein